MKKNNDSTSGINLIPIIDAYEQEFINQLKQDGYFDESDLKNPDYMFQWVRVEKDLKKKNYWYTRAAELNHASAQFFLAMDFFNVQKNTQRGIYWLKKSTELDHNHACFQLGTLYINGKLIDQNIEKGISLIIKSAELNNLKAQKQLVDRYLKGTDIQADNKAAFYWAQKAAEQRDKQSQYLLGMMHETGTGTTVDMNTAVTWYEKACKQEHKFACFALGKLYKNAMFDNKNINTSFHWFDKAHELGHDDAMPEMENIKSDPDLYKLVEEESVKAQRVLDIIQETREILNNSKTIMTKTELCAAQNTLHELQRRIRNEGELSGELEVIYETCDGPCWPDYPREILKSPDEWSFDDD